MDNENQRDELLALESIYNKEEFLYRKNNGRYEITVKIFINLGEKHFLIYEEENKGQHKISISHLPPLTLLISLPHNYPSTVPPNFKLKSSWLDIFAISKLCKKLDEFWELNKGQEILFTWIYFLQSETLEFLKIQESIDINYFYKCYKIILKKAQIEQESFDTKNSTNTIENFKENEFKDENYCIESEINKAKYAIQIDERAVSDIFVSINPIQLLIDYNNTRKEIEFKKEFYSCAICFTDKLGEHCTQFLPCSHVFCNECIISYFEIKLKEGTVHMLCPQEKCISEANSNQIKDLISPELFLKYESLMLNVTLDTMTDIIYCPRKICQYPVSLEPDEVMAICPVCEYAFCTRCKAVYHGIEPCKITVEKQNLAIEYKNASNVRKTELELRYGKRQLEKLCEDIMTENWIHSNSQQCPNCNIAIEKSDGCNKMTCWKCKAFFCWICKLQLKPNDPYFHYRDPCSPCFNMLFYGKPNENDNNNEFENFDYFD